MKYVVLVLSWVFGLIFLMVSLITIFIGRTVPAIPLLLITVSLLPPVGTWMRQITGKSLHVLMRSVLILLLFVAYMILTFVTLAGQPLYKSPEIQTTLMNIYDSKLEQWPVSFKSKYIDTQYGTVHVIVSGPEDAEPVLLLHATNLAAWSWLYNVKALNEKYRTYAIDYIGEAGKSSLYDIKKLPKDGKALSDLYADISNKLGISEARVVGASFGGFVATYYTIYYPERVKKLALLGPMGVTQATTSVTLKLMSYMFFPIKPFQDWMLDWAIGNDPRVLESCEDWMRLVITGVIRKGPPPMTFTPERLKEIKAPTLLIMGTKDRLVGDPDKVKLLAQNIPDIRVEVLDSGHLIGVEEPVRVNDLLREFFN